MESSENVVKKSLESVIEIANLYSDDPSYLSGLKSSSLIVLYLISSYPS